MGCIFQNKSVSQKQPSKALIKKGLSEVLARFSKKKKKKETIIIMKKEEKKNH